MQIEQQINLDNAKQKINSLIANIEKVIKGRRSQIELIITCLLAKGHVLIEDNPGSGKTVLAKVLAQSIDAQHEDNVFKRIQFTPDLLPMDLIGSYIFDEQNKDFIFKKGPLFCNVLLADEINRASPKVQSALLECMAENQITIGEQTFPLEKVFFTIATQNPIEMDGTFPLPSAQLDRFFMKIYFNYLDQDTELDIYHQYVSIEKNQENISSVLSLADIIQLQNDATHVYIHPEIIKSVRNMIVASRQHPDIILGASTRSGITLIKCMKSFALVQGRNYVTEDDLQKITNATINHRLIYRNKELEKSLSSNLLNKELERLAQLATK